jgi:hypothetical protein
MQDIQDNQGKQCSNIQYPAGRYRGKPLECDI